MFKSFVAYFFLSLMTLTVSASNKSKPFIFILGIAQDASYPQTSCYMPHCMPAWRDSSLQRLATSLAVIDPENKEKYLFEATPDIRHQLYRLHLQAPDNDYKLNGVFLTHGHMGHYTGLIHFGFEAASTRELKVYAMPRMKEYLSTNGPWSQLVGFKNIVLMPIKNNNQQKLSDRLSIIPMQVPHRDEYTETVGYKIIGPNKTALFIPDIDKWHKWKFDIRKIVQEVDYALIDGSFFSDRELPNRDMSKIQHPIVEKSMLLFSGLSKQDKLKIIFIHFNHSNPLLIDGSEEQNEVSRQGFRFAREGMILDL